MLAGALVGAATLGVQLLESLQLVPALWAATVVCTREWREGMHVGRLAQGAMHVGHGGKHEQSVPSRRMS